MKKIIFLFLLFLFPSTSFAQLDVYLSNQYLPYGKDVWTSANYPDTGSSEIQVQRYFAKEQFPPEYHKTDQEIKDLIDGIFPSLTAGDRQARYNSLISFEKQNLSQYLAIAISPDTEINISDKQSNGYLLTPFESTFQSCAINLTTRQTVVRNLINNIHSGLYTDINLLEYSNIRFGDCIIPFPDARRGSSVIADSFPSNKLAAQSLGGNPLRFGVLEDSVELFSLATLSLGGSYQGVQDNNLLDLQSSRVEQDMIFPKDPGGTKMFYIHQNHYTNPFIDSIVTGNSTTGYTIGGNFFDVNHPLFIRSTDSEEERILSGWQEIQEGIYAKTLIQDNTFDIVAGVSIPKQNVGVTTYYAIIYNYDITPPECPTTLFSHENIGNENFIFPAYPWFRESKYGYFLCSDDESGCFCDSSSVGCFIRDDEILSIPQEIPHSGNFQYRFWNAAGLSQVCSSPTDKELFYDTLSPDVTITLSGIPASSLLREYVNNNGVLYDGREIKEKRFYHISNDLSFEADENLAIQLQLYDPYDATQTGQGVSGLRSYHLSILEYENNNWVQKIDQSESFPDYNPLGTRAVQDSYTLDFQTFTDIEDIVTKIGSYQVYLDFEDAAGNQSRVIFYFDIIPSAIDITKSILEVSQRDIKYADNTSSYVYSLSLKDEYLNPIVGKNIGNIQHTCVSVSPCSELRLDMSGSTPSGEQALQIFNIDPVSDAQGVVHFSVSSRVPGVFSESFLVDVLNPALSLRFSAQNNTFLAPFIGTLESQVSSQWVSDTLPINQLSNYRIHIEDSQSLGYVWTLSNFGSYLRARHPDTSFVLASALSTGSDGVYFSGTFTSILAPEEQHKTLLEIIEGSVSGVIISYDISGKIVRYRLSFENIGVDPLQLGNTGELQNPVRIVGNLQGVGNTHNLSEKQNISELNSYDLRNILRKSVGAHIQTRVNNTTIGGVKYIDKTLDSNKEYTLESDPNFETLVVRNGNIHIRENFNLSGKNVGIVSYIDGGYNKDTGFEDVGNIYVEPEVIDINAFLYADGGLISTQLGNPISGDIDIRNDLLKKQLSIFGSLFTRNTLAGGRQLAGNYMLPGGEISTDQSLATQYDLYFLRRGNEDCVRDIYGFCDMPQYLIMEYDTRISSSPPKFFEMK